MGDPLGSFLRERASRTKHAGKTSVGLWGQSVKSGMSQFYSIVGISVHKIISLHVKLSAVSPFSSPKCTDYVSYSPHSKNKRKIHVKNVLHKIVSDYCAIYNRYKRTISIVQMGQFKDG